MLHRSTSSSSLSFSLRGVAYKVPPGGEVDIPALLAYAVKKRGLPLVPVAGAPPSEADVTPLDDSVGAWRGRAGKAKEAAERAASEATMARAAEERALTELAAEREAREGFVAELRDALGIEPTVSIIGAIKALRSEVDALTAPPPVGGAPKTAPAQARKQ